MWEHLELDLKEAELAGEKIQTRLTRVENLLKVGLVSEEEAKGLRAEMAGNKTRIEAIRSRMDLRKRFLEKKVTALEIEVQGRLATVQADLRAARSKVEALQERLTKLALRESLGLVSPTEVSKLQAELEAAKAEMALAAVEKGVLRNAAAR
ncbi:MAG: hypothetical protein PHI34_02845 [Acidobacteriota bacterium]|nr:hypothetical protein [Acidobacteriota bacterium]